MIPYGKQSISSGDIEAVIAILQSDYLTQGPQGPIFEQAFCKQVSAKYSVATNSATSALHIACLSLGVGPGDIVWTSPISFVASSNCALYCGARVDFVDIDRDTYNMSIDALRAKLVDAEALGELPKVVIPVHLAGQSCDMEAIYSLSLTYGFKVIEDASHATGARYKGDPVGSCKFSDIAVFSFHPVKIITAGEGGMAVTNSDVYGLKMGSLRSHGITRDPHLMTIEPDGPWFYQQLALGFNYRMTDIHAALGNSQLKRLDEFVSKRQAIAKIYNDSLECDYIKLPKQNANSYSSYHLYVIQLPESKGPWSRDTVFNRMRESGINVNLHYIPIYRHPFYESLRYDSKNFPNAEDYYRQAISIPIFPSMTDAEQNFVIEVLRSETVLKFSEPKGYQDLF